MSPALDRDANAPASATSEAAEAGPRPDAGANAGVSVVIPCRDAEATLGPTIRSVLNQTAAPLEIVVIDDGSRDASRAVAEGFGPPVSVRPGPARGAAAARSAGAALARGERLMFLDADDLLTPRTLAALVAALDGAPEPALALCPWDRLEREGEAWLVRPPSCEPRRPGQDDLAAWLTGTWSPPCAVLWDRAAYERAGGWGEEAATDDDGRLVMRALARGVPTRRTRSGLALYRRAPEGVSLSGQRFTAKGLASRVRTLEVVRDELRAAGRLDRYRAPLAEAAESAAPRRARPPRDRRGLRGPRGPHAGPPHARRDRSPRGAGARRAGRPSRAGPAPTRAAPCGRARSCGP